MRTMPWLYLCSSWLVVAQFAAGQVSVPSGPTVFGAPNPPAPFMAQRGQAFQRASATPRHHAPGPQHPQLPTYFSIRYFVVALVYLVRQSSGRVPGTLLRAVGPRAQAGFLVNSKACIQLKSTHRTETIKPAPSTIMRGGNKATNAE